MGAVQYLLPGDFVHIQNIEYDVNMNPVYVGIAKVGASNASPLWHIKQMTYDANNNPLTVRFANGTADFTNIWNNRATYSYS